MGKLVILFLAIFVIISAWFVTVPVPQKNRAHGSKQIKQNVTPSPSQNIIVLSPINEDIVSSPFILEGKAKVFENLVSIRLTGGNGIVLAQDNAYATSPNADAFGDFKKEIFFNTNQDSGVLEVFQNSPKDGSEIDKVSIPVRFKN